jgi:DNA repair ATPase RecN
MPIEGYVLLKIAQTLVFGIIAIVIGGPFARMIAHRLDRRDVQPRELQEMGERLSRIEQAVTSLGNDVMRLTEVQRITSRLLAADPPPRADRSPLSVSTRR